MKVRDLMTQNPYYLQPDDSIQHAAQEMKQHNVGALPVCDSDRLTGIITDRDIVVGCIAADRNPDECTVKEYMTANPVCVRPETAIEEALQLMKREQVRRLCVTQGGQIAGILSLGDLAARMRDDPAIARALAEISEPVRAAEPALAR